LWAGVDDGISSVFWFLSNIHIINDTISLISSACFIPKALFHNCWRLIVDLSLQYVSVVLHRDDDDDVVLVGVFAGVIMMLYAKLLLTLKIMHQ
jgi:hypothetical protein